MTLRKQLALTLVTLAVGALLIGGGTFAYFSATVTSEDNTFATGTIEYGEAVVFEAQTADNTKPGDNTTFTFALENGGTLDMDHIYLGITYDTKEPGVDEAGNPILVDSAEDLGTQLIVNSITLAGTSVTIPVAADADSDGDVTLSELEAYLAVAANALAVDLGGITVAEAQKDVVITIEFEETGADQNVYQGLTADIDFSFEARN